MRAKEAKPLTIKEEKRYLYGLCFGFATVYSYMAATEHSPRPALNWWKQALNEISLWDGKEESLSETITSNDPKTRDYLFQGVINYVLFNYGSKRLTDIETLDSRNFTNFLKPGSLFDSELGKIQEHAVAAGYFTADNLTALFDETVFATQAIHLVSAEIPPNSAILWTRHAIAVRYVAPHWYLYDPDNKQGESQFDSKADFIAAITKILGNSLAIQIATLSNDPIPRIFLEAYEKIRQEATILNELGLHVIALYSPNTVSEILDNAKTNDKIWQALSKAFTIQNQENKSGSDFVKNTHPSKYLELKAIKEDAELTPKPEVIQFLRIIGQEAIAQRLLSKPDEMIFEKDVEQQKEVQLEIINAALIHTALQIENISQSVLLSHSVFFNSDSKNNIIYSQLRDLRNEMRKCHNEEDIIHLLENKEKNAQPGDTYFSTIASCIAVHKKNQPEKHPEDTGPR